MSTTTYTAIVHQEGEWFVAQCAEIDVASQGRTAEEALANLTEALELYLEDAPEKPQSSVHRLPVRVA